RFVTGRSRLRKLGQELTMPARLTSKQFRKRLQSFDRHGSATSLITSNVSRQRVGLLPDNRLPQVGRAVRIGLEFLHLTRPIGVGKVFYERDELAQRRPIAGHPSQIFVVVGCLTGPM